MFDFVHYLPGRINRLPKHHLDDGNAYEKILMSLAAADAPAEHTAFRGADGHAVDEAHRFAAADSGAVSRPDEPAVGPANGSADVAADALADAGSVRYACPVFFASSDRPPDGRLRGGAVLRA